VPSKSKRYRGVKFTPGAIREMNSFVSHLDYEQYVENFSQDYLDKYSGGKRRPYADEQPAQASVSVGDERWTFDNLDEFLAEYRALEVTAAELSFSYGYIRANVSVSFQAATSTVSVTRHSRADVERVFEFFEQDLPNGRLADPARAIERAVRIFIGHGRNSAWRDLKDHLQDQHGFTVTTYETGARAGYSIQEVLQEMVDRASFALLVHSADDDIGSDLFRARQNVVHETGLFQGRLGFKRAIILREQGCEGFSNIVGTNELRYAKGNIREVFGDVIATIYREFGGPL
jgi:predicted nucleotide-binding protein